MTPSENMKNLRLMHGFSLKEIADKIGCAPNTISNWERGVGSPKMHFVQSLCELYNVTPNQFLGFEPCTELNEFIESKKDILSEIDKLQKQKSEIETSLRKYYEMLGQGN